MNKIKLLSLTLLLVEGLINPGSFHSKVIEVDVDLKKKEQTQIDTYQTTNDVYDKDDYISGTLYFGNTAVMINNVLSSQVKLYEKEYYSLPIQLKNSIHKITITSQDLNYACLIQSPYKVKGCARSEYNDILLDEIYRYGDLLHESIHLYSYQNDRVFSDEFMMIYEEEGNRINVQSGNTHNIYEYYVSAYLLYLNDNCYLNQVAPKTKSYFDRT